MKVGKEQYFELQNRITDIPYSMSKEWHDISYKDVMDKMLYFVNTTDDPRIACFGYLQQKRGIGSILNINGISREANVNIKEYRTFFRSIVEEGYNVIRLSDTWQYNPDFEVGIRRAGFVRPLGLELCPMSLIVNFKEDFSFHRKWRTHVRNSRSIGNTFHVVENPTIKDAEEFVRMFSELKDRKGLGYSCSPDGIMTLLNGNFKLFMCKNKEDKYVCGRLEYIYKGKAYDIYAANSYEGINSGAVYQLQEDILGYMKEIGLKEFDYGRIPPSDDNMDDIYIAKSYSGGHPIGYNGEWYYGKEKWVRYFFSLYSFVLHKSKMY